MCEASWADTETAVRVTLERDDVRGLIPLLADAVTWHGSGLGGGCHTRDEVASWLAELPLGFRLLWLRRSGNRIGLGVVDPAGNAAYELMALDCAGKITAIVDHPDAGTVESDLVAPTGPPAVTVAADALVPFVHVADVEASTAFYARLGFGVVADHHSGQQRVWALLRCGPAEGRHADLMVALADEPVDPAIQGVLFYLYTDDLAGLRRQLRAHGHLPGAITDGSPGPRRELRIDDPDGYCLMIAERR